MKRWYVGRTKPHQEQIAARHLREQAFEIYLPKKYRRERVGRSMKAIASLRFETYLFIAFDKDSQVHGPISNTRGMAELLCDARGNPRPLPSGVIANLRECEDMELEGVMRRVRGVRSDLRPGTPVIVERSDLWQGTRGTLIASVRGMATILVGSVVLTLADCDVRAVEEGELAGKAVA